MQPDTIDREIGALRATGTAVELRHARLSPDTDLMDPRAVPAAIVRGRLQAGEDATAIHDFWSG